MFVNQLTTTLYCIRKIRNFICMDACKLLVHTLVMVRLDYCNALLCGAREDVIRQLERLQRQVARVVFKKYTNDHTSATEINMGSALAALSHIILLQHRSASLSTSQLRTLARAQTMNIQSEQ